MNYKRVGLQLGLATMVAVTAWTVGPSAVEAAPVKPIVSTVSFKANLKDSFLVADDTDGLAARITTDRLNVRSGPSTSDKILGVLDFGTQVRGVQQGDWFQITYNGQTAYVHADWLRAPQGGAAPAASESESADAPAVSETVTMFTTANLNVRAGQGTWHAVLGVLPRGTEVNGGRVGEWFQITYNGRTAYVHSDYLRAPSQEAAASPAAQTPAGSETMRTTAYLNVRTGASTKYRILGVLNPGTELTGTSEGGWFRITYAGQTAFVSKSYLSAGRTSAATANTENRQETVSENRESVDRYATASVNVRTGPGTGHRILGVLSPGHKISGYTGNGWFETTYNGQTAYVSQTYLSTSAPAASAPSTGSSTSNSATINAIVADAWAQVGKRYVYGTAGPNTFDCSGLTYWLYNKHAGIQLPRSSASQASAGTSVSRSNMRPGDLIFFINPGASRVGHVAIYVGDGQYIHASTPSTGVKVDRTSGSYFQNNAVSIKRILP